MRLYIETNDKSLEIQGVEVDVAKAAVRSFCNALRNNPEKAKLVIEPTVTKPNTAATTSSTPQPKAPIHPALQAKPAPSVNTPTSPFKPAPDNKPIEEKELPSEFNRPRTLPLLSGSESTSVDSIHISDDEPPIITYLATYECPTCGDKGFRRLRETNVYMKCHKCSEVIFAEYAVPGKKLESNEEGVYFIGRTKLRPKEETINA